MTAPDPLPPPEGLPPLVRLYIRHCLIGFAASAVFVGLLLGFDVVGLRGLILGTQGGWMALFLLFFFNGLVFAGVQFAIAIMRMGDDDDDDDRGGRRPRVGPARIGPAGLQAVAVSAAAPAAGGPRR